MSFRVTSKKPLSVLKIGEECFRKAFMLSPAPTSISTISNGCYIDVNESALRLLGYTRPEVIGKSAKNLSIWNNPRDRSRFISKLLKKGSLFNEPVQLRTKYGQIKDVLCSCEVLTVNNEKAILALLLDVTEHKKMEKALRESERRLGDLIDFLPDATFAIDIEGKVIAWNRAIEDMLEAKKEFMLGKGDYEYALPFYGKRRPMLIDSVLKNKRIDQYYEFVNRKRGKLIIAESWVCSKGRNIYLWGIASPLYSSDGKIAGAIESVRDITERKRYEDDLRKRENELEAKARELKEMNAALKVLLKQRENDRKELEENILTNIKLLISPGIELLKSQLKAEKNIQYISALESGLNQIASPFARTLSTRYSVLTNREIQVAKLIRGEKTTKEIAEFLNISQSAVNMHRYRIRQKLGIKKRHNLRAFLSSLK